MIEFPEPLFEAVLYKKRICLVCGKSKAVSVLRTNDKEILPLCKKCASDWNFYGYNILKRIKPKQLTWNVIRFKFKHPLYVSWIAILRNAKDFLSWSKKMKRVMKRFVK